MTANTKYLLTETEYVPAVEITETNSPTKRKIFNIDIGDLSPEEAEAAIAELKGTFKSSNTSWPFTGGHY